MLRRALLVLGISVLASCNRSVDLPDPPPPPKPGTIQATVVYAQPGRSTPQPAIGAIVELLNTSITTKVTESNGHFTLSPIDRKTGAVLIRFDADGDGRIDHQRLLRLEDIHAGPDRDISLGEVLLGGNATIKGAIALSDRPGASSGLANTTIFVPEGPFIAYSSDNGAFLLDQLPEGQLTLTFFREGYESGSVQLTLQANQFFTLNTVVLTRASSPTQTTHVTGTVELADQTDASGVTVAISGSTVTATTNALGAYDFAAVVPGLKAIGFSKAGFKTVVLQNVLVEGAQTLVPTVTLAPGTSTMPVLDAGNKPPDPDGGGADAGAGDAGSGDAGLGDAGSGDAGSGDAGAGDAGAADSGLADAGSDAGSFDAGVRPIAVVTAVPSFVPTNSSLMLNGSNSIGARPFIYRWSQDAGPTVTVPNNNTVSAATPQVTMPNTTSVLKLALTVTDSFGLVSAPAEFTVVVAGGPPVAVISPQPPATVYGGQTITVGSAGSNDASNGSGVVSYAWSVQPTNAGITAIPVNGGTQLQLTMPASVTASTPVNIQLLVTDGLGIQSAPATASFSLSSQGSAPTWTLDAGPLQIVAGGSLTTLSANAQAPSAGPTFSYLWSPAGVTDAGTANWVLLDPTAASTQFVAPVISGPNQPIVFTVTATNTSGGLMPAQLSAVTVVHVQDRRPPQVVGTSVASNLTGSPFGVWVDFDEDLQSALPTSTSTLGAPSYPGGRSAVLLGQRRARVVFDGFALQDAPIRLSTGAVRDLSPYNGGNPATSLAIDYTSSFLWPAPAVALDSTTEPNPSLALVAQPLGEAGAYLVGRRDSKAMFQKLLNLTCDAGCTVTDDTSAPNIALGATTRRIGPRAITAAGVPYVSLQTADYEGDAGVAAAHLPSGWATIAPPPGTLFGDGTALYSAFVSGGSVKMSTYDPMLATWGSPVVVASNATDYTPGPGSVAQAWGWATVAGTTFIIARTAAGDLRSYQRVTPASPWTTSSLTALASGDAIVDFRVVGRAPPADNSLIGVVVHQSQTIDFYAFGAGGTGLFPGLTGIRSLDIFPDEDVQWVASIEAGQLLVRQRRSNAFTIVPGPLRAGAPNNSFNFDIACTADSPAIARSGEHLVVAWQEKCGAGLWKTYLRYVR